VLLFEESLSVVTWLLGCDCIGFVSHNLHRSAGNVQDGGGGRAA
jgi:hypothetical protein